MFMSFADIVIEQKKPLDEKIEIAVTAIKSGFDVCQSRAALAFSGGKDSTVLWHLIRERFPKEAEAMAVIFGNTGVEYPESLKFARKLGKEWGGDNFFEARPDKLEKDELKYKAQCMVLRYLGKTNQLDKVLKEDGKLKSMQSLEKACPKAMWEYFRRENLIWKKGTPKSYWWCVDQYGYPLLGKNFSKLKARRINIDCFLRFSKSESKKEDLMEYYHVLQRTKISQACCDILKKNPSTRIQSELKVDVIFKGLLASESRARKTNFSKRGYLFKSKRNYIDVPFYHCNPLSTWTDDDVWEYIHRYKVPYSPLYDVTYIDKKGNICNIKRNGCIGCYTDYGRTNSHMYVLRQTHPHLWKAVMKYGMASEIKKLRATEQFKPSRREYNRLSVLDMLKDSEMLEWALDSRPCAFD